MTPSESTFVSHLPCPACGSSDANALYSDGHTYCWKCKAYAHGAGGEVHTATKRPHHVTALLHPLEIKALTKRAIDESTCAKFGYGFADYKDGRVQVAPYFDRDGKLVAQKVRGPDKSFKFLGDPKEAQLFGQQLWRDGGKKVVVTEGEIDCLSVSKVQGNKWPVVSIPNGAQGAAKAITRALDWLEGFEEVVFMFDMDESGQAAAQECALLLTPGKAKIATLPLKDPNEMLQAGRGKELIDAIWGAKVYRPDGLVFGDDIWEHIIRVDKFRAATIPHAGLQQKTRGLRGGEVITFCAGTGAGKSTIVRELAYSLMQQGERVGYIALEESVQRSALGFCSIALNKPLHLDRGLATDADLRATFDKLKEGMGFYDHWGSIDSENLLHKIRYMVRGLGCNFIVLDHISIVVSGIDTDDERKALDVTMTRLASLAQETGACILIVSHLRKAGQGASHEEGRVVTMSDLRGTNAIAQLSHTIISIERDQQDADGRHISLVRVLKCRHTGDTGVAGHMKYDQATGRLLECEVGFEGEAVAPIEGPSEF